MKYRSVFIIFLSVSMLVSCNAKQKNETASKYKNHILLEAKGFKVKDAYLVFNDSTRVGDDNKVKIGQHVNLILLIDSGWNAIDGRVYAGVGQKVETSGGAHIFEEKDMMGSHP